MKTKESSLFSKAADIIVSQIDRRSVDRFIPALLHESHELDLMKMVFKQSPRWPWQRHKYKWSDFILSDILQEKPPLNPGVSERVFGPYQGTFEHEHSGSIRAKITKIVSARLEGRGSAELLLSPVKVKKETVNVNKLRESRHRCDMQHELVQKIQQAKKMPKCPYVLAVVTERVVTTTSYWEISETWQLSGGVGFTVKSAMMGVEDTADAKVQKAKKHSITIDAGTVIAYGVRELNIKETGDLVFSEPGMQLDYARGSDIEADSLFDEGLDLTELQNPEKYLSSLAELPQSTRSALFQRFCEVMKDRDALSDVENTLEEWCTGDASVSHSNSASAILDLLRPYLLRTDPDSHIESDGPGSAGTPGSPLNAVHLLVSAMEALPDEALSLLSESSPDVLEALNVLLNMLDLKDQKKNCSPLPLESLPLPLQDDDKAFDWVQQLLITSYVNLRKEAAGLLAERESDAGVMPLVLCVTVQGLSYLCDQQN